MAVGFASFAYGVGRSAATPDSRMATRAEINRPVFMVTLHRSNARYTNAARSPAPRAPFPVVLPTPNVSSDHLLSCTVGCALTHVPTVKGSVVVARCLIVERPANFDDFLGMGISKSVPPKRTPIKLGCQETGRPVERPNRARARRELGGGAGTRDLASSSVRRARRPDHRMTRCWRLLPKNARFISTAIGSMLIASGAIGNFPWHKTETHLVTGIGKWTRQHRQGDDGGRLCGRPTTPSSHSIRQLRAHDTE